MKNKLTLIVLGLVALSTVLGIWFYQRNSYSKDILKLEILAPEEADLAQEISYTVKYKNNGNVKLTEARLVFEFPEYSIVDNTSSTKEMLLEDIYPGQEQTLTFKARLLGKEGDLKKSQAWLSYQPKNLNARYESKTSQTIKIKSVPLTLEFDLPSKIESGKDISFQLNYFSNADYPLTDLGLKAEYPSEFEFKTAKPQALEKTDWNIGLLNKAEGGRIAITGKLAGEIGEEKNFKAQLGTWQNGTFVLLKETVRAVQIVSPSLYISQQINSNPQYVASPGDTLHYEIFFKNIGNEAFDNLFLVTKLEGEAFDLQTLKAPLADFEIGDNSLIFDWRRISKLQYLGAREEGKVEFWIDVKDNWAMTGDKDKNPLLTTNIYLSQAQEKFTTKVNTKLEPVQKGYYEGEVFGNSGPIPPKVGQSTAYTITWQAKNYFNEAKNVKMRATLGKGVTPTGQIFPDGSRLTFDSVSREMVWEIGDMKEGDGILTQAPNVSFQIIFTPLSSQLGKVVDLIGQAQISGEDQFTGVQAIGSTSAINTTLPDDESVSDQEGIVH